MRSTERELAVRVPDCAPTPDQPRSHCPATCSLRSASVHQPRPARHSCPNLATGARHTILTATPSIIDIVSTLLSRCLSPRLARARPSLVAAAVVARTSDCWCSMSGPCHCFYLTLHCPSSLPPSLCCSAPLLPLLCQANPGKLLPPLPSSCYRDPVVLAASESSLPTLAAVVTLTAIPMAMSWGSRCQPCHHPVPSRRTPLI